MSLQDSYVQLAGSIARRLREDLPVEKEVDLSTSIDRALRDESQRAELSLTPLRLVVIAVTLGVSIAACVGERLDGVQCLTILVPECLWVLGASGLFIVLRRGWYRVWLRQVVPIIEVLLIALAGVSFWMATASASTIQNGFLVYTTSLSAYLVFSGVLRLSRSSAQLSTVLALLLFLFVAEATHASVAASIATVAVLGILGLATGRAPTLVRQIIVNKLGRAAISARYEEARLAVQAREQVLKIVSHDLRNPLHTIAMSTALLLEGVGSAEQQKRQVAIIRRAGERMNRLVKDLLDVAKMESGRLSISPRALELPPLLREADEMLRPLVAEKSITFDVFAGTGLPKIHADSDRILQVLSNLVGNAVKFTPSGGRIGIRVGATMTGVQFSVEDSGPGIPPEQLPHIFGVFWQADPSDRRGIGLGLAISKALVEAHGGRLWVESHVGIGTVFHFTLA
jgi:signal transduction histidine kinase